MEELDLKELIGMFWDKKIQIILIVIIFTVIGVIYTMGFVTPVYTSSTTLVLAASDKGSDAKTSSESITTTDITLNSKLVSTYSELVKSKNVLREVKANLNIDIDEGNLRKNITITSVKNTELIEIGVTNKNPNYAANVANEIANVFTKKVAEIYNINNVHVVDEAEVSTNPSNINHKKDIAIFAGIGIVIAIIYVMVLNILDTTIKTREDVEKAFKVPVLATIPMNVPEKKGGKR